MTNKDIIVKNEKWEYVVEQIRATIIEAVTSSHWILVEGYWNVGKLLREEFGEKDLTKTLTALSAEVSVSTRTLWRALACYDKYPDIQQIPEGKAITWNKLITKYLPNNPKLPEPRPKMVKCPKCGGYYLEGDNICKCQKWR